MDPPHHTLAIKQHTIPATVKPATNRLKRLSGEMNKAGGEEGTLFTEGNALSIGILKYRLVDPKIIRTRTAQGYRETSEQSPVGRQHRANFGRRPTGKIIAASYLSAFQR